MLYRIIRTTTLFWLLTAGLLLAGCSESDNPIAPEVSDEGGQEEVIRTPKYLKITKVSVSKFGDKDGGVWDFSTTVSKRRPDIYVQLRGGTSVTAPFYVSDVVDDAFSGAPYGFTGSDAGVGLPKNHSASRTLYVELMDDDGLSADDFMGKASFKPLTYYRNDNALGFDKEFSGTNSTRLRVTGTWVY